VTNASGACHVRRSVCAATPSTGNDFTRFYPALQSFLRVANATFHHAEHFFGDCQMPAFL